MFRRWSVLAVLAVLAVAVASPIEAAPQDVQVGQVRATLERRGTTLRQEAKMLGTSVAVLPYGTHVRIDRIEQPWIQVTVVGGGPAAAAGRTGWLRAVQTVDPATLGPSDRVRAMAATSGDRGISVDDVSAAGRGFGAGRRLDAQTESEYRTTTAELQRAYPIVDRLESANRGVPPEAIEAFVQQGRLGRPGQ